MDTKYQPLPSLMRTLIASEVVIALLGTASGGPFGCGFTAIIFLAPSIYFLVKITYRKRISITFLRVVAIIQALLLASLTVVIVIADIDDMTIGDQRYSHFYAYVIGGTAFFITSIRIFLLTRPSTKKYIREYLQ